MVSLTLEMFKEAFCLFGFALGVVFTIAAIVWLIIRKTRGKGQIKSEEERPSEDEDDRNSTEFQIVTEDDEMKEDRTLDFRNCPRSEEDRIAARREFVIQMLIAESMSK